MVTKIYNKAVAGVLFLFLFTTTPLLLGSCSDFFNQESDNVIYSENDHLTNWPDTVYSVMGILNKLQVIADRTILLGEVRGDLVTLTSEASSDLRDMANFNMQADNQYNQPRDYYAVINNCNYYLQKADTTLKSNRNEYIFMKEYAAVKAIRAWTYLQLALNYGSVPFVTEPILTKEESERDYPRYDLQQVCEYFLNDLAALPERYDNEYPGYGDNLRGNNTRLFFFPLNIIRGDLNLYLGSLKGTEAGRQNFQQAAISYYKYINERNGLNSYYSTGIDMRIWNPGAASWTSTRIYNGFLSVFSNESYGPNSELITMIPGDSIRAEGYYSELRNLFISREENNQKVSITPSLRIQEISEAQANCVLSSNGLSATYAPTGLSDHRTGDLRLGSYWTESYDIDDATGTRIETQDIRKYATRNVHIYRRQMVYLRFAEALNWAGQPLMAYKILERGLSNSILQNEVYPFINKSDSTWIASNFSFPNSQYYVLEAENIVNGNLGQSNMVGIHSRGSGWTPMNEEYRLAYSDVVPVRMTDEENFEFDEQEYQRIRALQQPLVDSLIINESALEFAFEGTRFYDLMRYCLRQSDPGATMEHFIAARRGEANRSATLADLRKSLRQPANWYLNWNGRLGLTAE